MLPEHNADCGRPLTHRRSASRGQTLAEFAIVVPIFMILLLSVVDFGMAIYKYNGVSQAAREIARVASVHPGTPLGTSSEVNAVVGTQKKLVPGLGTPAIACVNESGVAAPGPTCTSPNWVSVTITSPYKPISPLLGITGTWTLKGASNAQIQ